VAREDTGRKESEGGKIYTEDNISGWYFAGRSATRRGEREAERERREWLIFGVRGRSFLAGLKNVSLLIYTLF